MKTISKDELKERVMLHKKWLNCTGGERLVLVGYDLSNSDLSGRNLSDSNLRDSNLSNSDLSNSDLSNSDLSGSNLSYSNLRGSNLSGSNLSDSNLRGSNLSGSNLSDSNLSYSNLRGSNLSGSNLSGSDLSDSNLSYSDLRFVIGNMREIKSMQLDKWMVTYTQTGMAIGCQQHPIDDWFAFGDEEISSMDDYALDWWKKWRGIIQQILNVEGS